jgi:transglutaminase-like putative cysteine protease
MLIRFGFEITLTCQAPVPMLLALSPHPDCTARFIGSTTIRSAPEIVQTSYQDLFDNRITRIVMPEGGMTLSSDCIAEIESPLDTSALGADQCPVEQLPSATLLYLTASRFCESDELGAFAWQQFGHVQPGWPRVQAICDFVYDRTTFGYKFGRPTKTAHDTFREMTGVCRDFAHLLVTLCRAMNIPARYVSGYLGDIGVPATGLGDFSGWCEVYIDSRWYTFDARHNIPRLGRILMVRGRDATDVAMITSFGAYELIGFRVWTHELTDRTADEDFSTLLATLPVSEALVSPSSARITI